VSAFLSESEKDPFQPRTKAELPARARTGKQTYVP